MLQNWWPDPSLLSKAGPLSLLLKIEQVGKNGNWKTEKGYLIYISLVYSVNISGLNRYGIIKTHCIQLLSCLRLVECEENLRIEKIEIELSKVKGDEIAWI